MNFKEIIWKIICIKVIPFFKADLIPGRPDDQTIKSMYHIQTCKVSLKVVK